MLIVSQNKVSILNLDKVNLIGTNRDGEVKARLGINDIIVLGTYKTEERAKEVLQEITNRYKNWENIKVGQPSGICLPVYEMPKE